ncbi:hypothetical protein ABH931_005280 [Streptacidiphilus sp. MAP12-33]|uniref:hypothetical protein n=1 Tax=Streptacidiphilus sp. MAP12-33 TaxID=3156266 RepID=UPI00351386C9
MNAFDEAVLHEALEERVAPVLVPPLPLESIVGAGTRRRRARRALGSACVAMAAAAVCVLSVTAGSTPSQVVTPPARTLPASPVPGALASGVLRGSSWSVRLDNYATNGGYCSYWQLVVDGRTNPTAAGGCEPHAASQSDLSFEEAEVLRDPANFSSPQIGVLFLGAGAPDGAVALRARWAGGSVEAQVFHLRGDRRGYFVLAVPFVPGHPKSYYVTTLDFLNASGHVLPGGFDNPPFPWHIDYGRAKK